MILLIMFQHIVYTLANRQGLSTYVRTCKTRLDTTTKFMVATSLFNLFISSFLDSMFSHAWTWLLIYHDGSNNVVQVSSLNKPWTVCSNMHVQACQQAKTSCAFVRAYCLPSTVHPLPLLSISLFSSPLPSISKTHWLNLSSSGSIHHLRNPRYEFTEFPC